MAPRSKTTTNSDDTPTVPNADLEHTAGGVTTRDGMDAGVPMTPGKPDEPVGPEDALGGGPTRGDYRDRLDGTVHMETRLIPADRRVPGGPVFEQVPQGSPELIGDEPGKGGVSTEAALEAAKLTAPAVIPHETVAPVTTSDGSGGGSDGSGGGEGGE